MYDIVIVNVPGTLSKAVPAAPALLKANIQKSGFKCKTIDYNIKFFNSDIPQYKDIENYFLSGLNPHVHDLAVDIIKGYVLDLVKIETKFIGISVFTYQNKIATKIFCEEIRKHSSVKIVLGGQGISDGGLLGSQGFVKELYDLNLIDYYIKSEGENSIVELLKNNTSASGINSGTFEQINDLDQLPLPDYSDYDLTLYDDTLPITGSRGCVRACSFCDVHDHWSYKTRKGELVANEVIELYKKYNIRKFQFTDSLINGSLREFKKFCAILAEFNKEQNVNIQYGGQYIVRSSKQLDETYWINLALSGASYLTMGVETGSDKVRFHMNKKFTNDDLDYTMEMLDKYNITCVFLMIIGYPTETEEDFQDTLDMFWKYKKYANRIITNITFGATLAILPGTPLYKNSKNLNLELDKHENNWIALDNESLTLTERIRRRHFAKEYALSLGYKIEDDNGEHMLELLSQSVPKFEARNKIKKIIQINSSYGK